MEIPEHLHELVDQLGRALVQALSTDAHCRKLAQAIQEEGYDLAILLEATLALKKREATEDPSGLATSLTPGEPFLGLPVLRNITLPASSEPTDWSEEDKAFLRTFRISLD